MRDHVRVAVTAASLSRVVFGPDPAFSAQGLQLVSLLELPWILMLGAAIGSRRALSASRMPNPTPTGTVTA